MIRLTALLCILALPLNATSEFGSWVQCHYKGRRNLDAWVASERAIHKTLLQWDSRIVSGKRIVDGNALDLLGNLMNQSGISYIASHQESDGSLTLTDKAIFEWNRANELHCGNSRILILDTCYAEAAELHERLDAEASYILYAAGEDERTWELWTKGKRPMDFEKHFPRTVQWLKSNLGPNWDGHISYLGFVWVMAFIDTPDKPANKKEWETFLSRCQRKSNILRETRAKKSASFLHWKRIDTL